MASTARYVCGDCKPIAVKCDPNYPIEVGDLLFLEPEQQPGPAGRGHAQPGQPDPRTRRRSTTSSWAWPCRRTACNPARPCR